MKSQDMKSQKMKLRNMKLEIIKMITQETLERLKLDNYLYKPIFITNKYYKVGHHEIVKPIYNYKKTVILSSIQSN